MIKYNIPTYKFERNLIKEATVMSSNGFAQTNKDNANIPPPPPVNAEAIISIINDALTATIKIIPPRNGGADLSYNDLKTFLTKKGIVYGIDENVLKTLGSRPTYNVDTVVARGILPVNGTDAELIYYVEADRKLKPKEREDGSVDFKDLGTIQEVKKDTVLCKKIPLVEGTVGITVMGKNISQVPGKDKTLPAGKNTVLSEDGLQLLAMVDGHVSITGGKINILDVFIVQGNVSNATGNINFSGNVVVRGDVVQGFTVDATGDVTINGSVEAATIKAGGSLIIRGGFQGGESGRLEVGGDAACLFIENGRISVKGNLTATSIMNSTVKCGGEVTVTGKGLIRGSYVMARISVTANLLGSRNATSASTVLEVGNDPVVVERYNELTATIQAAEKNIANLELMISSLIKLKEAGKLTPDKADNLIKAQDYIRKIRETNADEKEEYDELEKQITNLGYGKIIVYKSAYPGLKIVIGPDTLVLEAEYPNSIFTRGPMGITFTSAR